MTWRIALRNSKYSTTYYTWEGLYLDELIGYEMNLTFTSEGNLSLEYTDGATEKTYTERNVKITNLTGESITEVYIYPSNNSKWGNSRTKEWIYNYESATFVMSAAEVSVNTQWTVNVCFRSGRSYFRVTWEDWDIEEIIGCELVIYKSDADTYSIKSSPLEEGSV